jgi:hypothetical protein
VCDLCKTFGKGKLEGKPLKKAMAAITPAMLKSSPDHLQKLVDLWMGFEPGAETDDPDKAEAWEKSHR